MFKSQLTGKQYGKGVKPLRVVVEWRDREYINEDGKISRGVEIVKELTIGPDESRLVEGAL